MIPVNIDNIPCSVIIGPQSRGFTFYWFVFCISCIGLMAPIVYLYLKRYIIVEFNFPKVEKKEKEKEKEKVENKNDIKIKENDTHEEFFKDDRGVNYRGFPVPFNYYDNGHANFIHHVPVSSKAEQPTVNQSQK